MAVILLVVVSYLSGCEKPPTDEIIRAERALDKASAQNAQFYVPDPYKKAQALLEKARALVREKHYGEARKNALESLTLSNHSLLLIPESRERMRAEVQKIILVLESDTESLRTEIEKLKKRKGIRSFEKGSRIIEQWNEEFRRLKESAKTDEPYKVCEEAESVYKKFAEVKRQILEGLRSRKK
jgi:hypothetical protein